LAWSDLLAGIAFFLVIEGLFPFAAPRAWRRGIAAIAGWEDRHLRSFGIAVVVTGLVLLYFVRG
jgi:uncharacterized protein YjeT (DUF2065 family)